MKSLRFDQDTLRVMLRARQSSTTFAHTLGVVAAAELLAQKYPIDPGQVRLGALLHDLARDLETTELLKLAAEYGILVDEIEAREPLILHARVGAAMARIQLGVEDPAVVRAVELHTTGAPDMTRLDKIIYVADYIEPGRDFPGVDEVRRAAGQDLEQALVLAMNGTLANLLRENRLIHPRTVEARNQVLDQLRAATDHRWNG